MFRKKKKEELPKRLTPLDKRISYVADGFQVKEFTGLIFHCPNCDEVFHLHIATKSGWMLLELKEMKENDL